MHRETDVIVIGAGQAGLAMSQVLTTRAVGHVLLERGRVGERWLSERRPGLRLLTPNWMMRLPGAELPPGRDGFMEVRDFAAHLDRYGARIGAPVVRDCAVQALTRRAGRFHLRTSQGTWCARAVVIATGACDRSAAPNWAGDIPRGILQVSAPRYRSPGDLPEGPVLVVGASASGVQIAAEIRASGREVTIATGRHVRTPRRYRGRDLFHWLDASGFLSDPLMPDADVARLRAQPSLQLYGNEAGRDIGLDSLAAQGVRIAGRATGLRDGKVQFADTLAGERAAAERRRATLLDRIDGHIAETGMTIPVDPFARRAPGQLPEPPSEIALRRLDSIVWATGYRRDYPWLGLPVLDGRGDIRSTLGLTEVPGLYVLGLPFQRHRASAFIDGVGRDAEALLPAILSHLCGRRRIAA